MLISSKITYYMPTAFEDQEFFAEITSASAVCDESELPGPIRDALAELDAICDEVRKTVSAKIASKDEGEKPTERPGVPGAKADGGEGCPVIGNAPSTPNPLTIPFAAYFPSLQSHRTPTGRGAKIRPWDRLSKLERFQATTDTAGTHKDAIAFNLNLTPDREQKTRSCADPVRLVSDRVNRALSSEGIAKLPYSFVLEISPEGRLHVHGTLIAHQNQIPAIREALRRAGGALKGRGVPRQLRTKDLFYTPGWNGYTRKARMATTAELGVDKIIFVSTSMTAIARDRWETLRQRANVSKR